jgi:hypothetical protein
MGVRTILIASSIALGGMVPAAMALAQRSEDGFEGAAWRRALGHAKLEVREREYARLVDEALKSPAAREALREWARGEDELAWTSRLALRELELREQLEARRDPVFGHFPHFGGDPFGFDADDFGRRPTLEDFFGQLPPAAGGTSRSESFQLESTPDGVKVEVREEVDGEERVTTYEAGTLEELLESHPELRERIGVTPRAERTPLEEWFGQRARPLPAPWTPGDVPTDRLGILMLEPDRYTTSHEAVEPGTGLLVQRVLPGTLAAGLGIRTGDIVVRLNGETIRGADDVRTVLAARDSGDEITALVVDADGAERTLRWEPARRRMSRRNQI